MQRKFFITLYVNFCVCKLFNICILYYNIISFINVYHIILQITEIKSFENNVEQFLTYFII